MSLKANFSWTFAGNMVNAVCQWGVLAVLARTAICTICDGGGCTACASEEPGAVAVGQFGLGLNITAPVMALAMLQLRSLLVTDVRGEFRFADYLGVRLVWTVIGFLAVMAITGAWGLITGGEGLGWHTALVVVLVGVSKCVDSISDIVRGLFQRLERMNYSGISLMIRGPFALLAMGLTMWWTQSLPLAVIALAGAWFVTLIVYDIGVARRLLRANETAEVGDGLRPSFQPSMLWRVTWKGMPLGVVMGIITLQTSLPRLFIKGYFPDQQGEAMLGYFLAVAYPMVSAMMIATAMGQSAAPRLSRYFVEDLRAYRRLLVRLVLISIVLGAAFIAGTVVIGKPMLGLLYGPQFAEYQPSFILLSVATAIQLVASCGGYGLTAARYFRIQVVLVAFSCIVTTLFGMWLIPKWGVRGAAITVISTSSSMLLMYFSTTLWAMRRREREMATAGRVHEGTNGPGEETAE